MDGFLDALRRSLFPVQVLVVDDDAGARRALCGVLLQHKYQVLEAACATDALALLASSHVAVDLIISDIQMPGMAGDALGREVRARWGDVPILFISGDPSFATLPAEVGGPARFLAKPFGAPELLGQVHHLLGTTDASAEALLRPAFDAGS